MPGALEGITVVSLEQAVAAPLATARLADSGARVIKLERPEGDFARGYDDYVHGLSSYFVWNNRGKQSCTVDLKQRDSLFPSMRSTSDTGASNFTNPGLELLGIGADVDLLPSLRVSMDVSHILFANTAPLQRTLGRSDLSRTLGTDASVDAIYRPFISQNIIARLSLAKLFAAPAARPLVGSSAPVSMFFNLVLTY